MRFASGAYRYALPAFVLAVPAFFVTVALGLGLAIVGGAILAFFRDPERTPPESGIISPADGTVSVVRTDENSTVRVGVFMNVTDVHVNRAPLSGVVQDVTHRPGANRPAFSKESDRNEAVRIDCQEFSVVLIAGWFARRIHPYVEAGDSLERGERLGHIAFGSRADVLLPPAVSESDLTVETGDSVRAGETVIADVEP